MDRTETLSIGYWHEIENVFQTKIIVSNECTFPLMVLLINKIVEYGEHEIHPPCTNFQSNLKLWQYGVSNMIIVKYFSEHNYGFSLRLKRLFSDNKTTCLPHHMQNNGNIANEVPRSRHLSLGDLVTVKSRYFILTQLKSSIKKIQRNIPEIEPVVIENLFHLLTNSRTFYFIFNINIYTWKLLYFQIFF